MPYHQPLGRANRKSFSLSPWAPAGYGGGAWQRVVCWLLSFSRCLPHHTSMASWSHLSESYMHPNTWLIVGLRRVLGALVKSSFALVAMSQSVRQRVSTPTSPGIADSFSYDEPQKADWEQILQFPGRNISDNILVTFNSGDLKGDDCGALHLSGAFFVSQMVFL